MSKYLLHEVASSFKAISVRSIGVLSTLLVSIYIVRQYGVEINGAFQLAFAYVMIASAIAKLGQDQLALREIAKYCAKNDPAEATKFLQSSLKLVTQASTIVSVILVGVIAYVNKPLLPYIALFAPTVITISIIWVIAEAMRGWQHVNIAVFWQAVFVPLVFLIVIFSMTSFSPIKSELIALIYSIVSIVALFAILRAWRSTVNYSLLSPISQHLSFLSMFHSGKHFWLLAIMTGFAGWIDLLVLSTITSNEVIGIYQPIVRTGTVVAVFINMATSTLVARLAILYAKGNNDEFLRLTRTYWLAIVISSLILCIMFILNINLITSAWGPEFAEYNLEFGAYIGVQLFQSIFILPMLISPVIGLEKELAWIQVLVLPLKIISIIIGFIFMEILGVIYALGLCTFVTSLLVFFFYIRQLKRKGMPWQQLVVRHL